MTRRAWGVAMLAIVIITAVVVPAALDFGPRTAGVAVRAPIPGPPAAGDCLTSPYLGAGSALSVGIAIGVAPYAACPSPGDSRRDFGEIVSVTPDVHGFPTISAGQSPPDPDACRPPVLGYLGWAAEPWDPVFTDMISLVGPDTVQYASGQRWIACALITGRDGYPGSVRDGAFGRASDLYGRCESTRSALRPRVGCGAPHDAEVFGVALVGFDELSDLADSCTRLVVKRTGLADPTAGGMLQVRAAPSDPNTVPPDVSASKQSMTCAVRVVGDGLLAASLVGVGDRPLPFCMIQLPDFRCAPRAPGWPAAARPAPPRLGAEGGVTEGQAGQLGLPVDPQERAGLAEVAERAGRVLRRRPVRRLVVADLAAQPPVVVLLLAEPRHDAGQAGEGHGRGEPHHLGHQQPRVQQLPAQCGQILDRAAGTVRRRTVQGRAGHLQQSHHALDVRSAPALLFSVAGEGGADQLGGRGSGLLLTLLAGLAAVLIRVKDRPGMAGRVRVPMGPALIAGTLLALWL